jgi:hypothetical protein
LKSVSNHENIVDVISAIIGLKKVGSHYVACCPFHKEKTPSFSVSEEKQIYYCVGCGVHGDSSDFIDAFDAGEMVALTNINTFARKSVGDTGETREQKLEIENTYLKTLLIHLLKKQIK